MKAIKVIDKKPIMVDVPEPKGESVKVKVVSSSICGSDIHMMEQGMFGDHIIGHEFAGLTLDGRAVAIEPITGCGQCAACDEGQDSSREQEQHVRIENRCQSGSRTAHWRTGETHR